MEISKTFLGFSWTHTCITWMKASNGISQQIYIFHLLFFIWQDTYVTVQRKNSLKNPENVKRFPGLNKYMNMCNSVILCSSVGGFVLNVNRKVISHEIWARRIQNTLNEIALVLENNIQIWWRLSVVLLQKYLYDLSINIFSSFVNFERLWYAQIRLLSVLIFFFGQIS